MHMSGHSHFKTVMHRKSAEDQKRGKIFSKLARQISVAARDGEDPETNAKLRQAIEEARRFNLPKTNVDRAIQRGVGKLPGAQLEEITFEAYGPGNIAIIIEGITDNKNRTLSEVKKILQQHNGKLAGEGSVKWLFERKGCVVMDCKAQEQDLASKENLEMIAIEAGAEDIYWHNDFLDVYTKSEELDKVKQDLESKGIKIESASLDWVAKEEIEPGEKDKEALQKLFEALDENEAVQEIYSNLKA